MFEANEIKKHRLEISKIYYSDGVIELCIGIMLLFYAMGYFIDGKPYALGFMPIVLIAVIKRKFTFPRIGYVRLQSGIIKDNKIMTVFLIISIFLGIILMVYLIKNPIPLGVLNEMDNFEKIYKPFVAGLFFLIFILVAARFTGVARWNYLAVLSFILILGNYFPFISFREVFISMGLILVIIGSVLMIKFAAKYPEISTEDSDEIEG